MSKKTPRRWAADMSDPNKPGTRSQADPRAEPPARRGSEQNGGTSSSPESGSPNGDAKPSGKRRRSKKCCQEPQTPARVNGKARKESADGAEPQVDLLALSSECANVWFQRSFYEQAESLYQRWLANAAQLNGSAPSPENKASSAGGQAERRTKESSPSLDGSPSTASSPDDGYQSQAATPGSPVAPVPPRHPLNGLPPALAEMFGDVWLEKPRYDRAEAAFYQNVDGDRSARASRGGSAQRRGDPPRGPVQAPPPPAEEKRSQVKAEVFHALHPIQEEDESAETLAKGDGRDLGRCHFLHPDSERVWSDKWRYHAAELRFHQALAAKKSGGPAAGAASVGFGVPPEENDMSFLAQEKIWFDKSRYDEAERRFFQRLNGASPSTPAVCDAGANAILQDIARARENIQKSLAGSTCGGGAGSAADQEVIARIGSLELENKSLNRVVEDLRASLCKLECRVAVLEKRPSAAVAAPAPSPAYANGGGVQRTAQSPDEDDDDVDLFGSDDDEEAEKVKEQRLKEYAERKAKKPAVIAKSSILLDVKPWDDETDMGELEARVRSVQADGLLWGMSKLVPVGYGINKLQISCVVEDDKVGTDLYHFTMAYAYWRAGRHLEHSVFELFFRENPFCGCFSLFAGLDDCLLFLANFGFADRDVDFLRSVLPPATDPAFFQFLRSLDCSGVTLRSVPEGTAVFAREPLMEVAGPLAVVQLLETSLLCLVNYASLVCSNAARFRLASGPRRKLLEMGLRRAQGPDGGLTASRYSYIGGFDLTSNVQAGLLFGIPVAGTMAHSYVTSFTSLDEVSPQTLVDLKRDQDPVDFISLSKGWLARVCELLKAEPGKIHQGELAAFLSYAIAYPHNFLPVIDSYSVAGGLLNFCAVALALCELGYRPVGVRLDSGDLCKQSLDVRCVLRLCSEHFSTPAFDSLIIVGTNNISEQTMVELNDKENEIDVVGVGTHLVTCTKQPSLGCVYKLVEVRGKPRMKISEDPQKSTVPGRKSVYRLIDDHGHPFLDLVCLALEPPPEAGRPLRCHPLGADDTPLSVAPAQVLCLRQEVFTDGRARRPLSSAAESKANAAASLGSLHPRHKRLQEPDSYTVALSEKLYDLVTELRRGSAKKSNFILGN